MIETPNKAFHAGKSLHEGISGLNSHYLGVELLVPGVNDYSSFSKKIKTSGTYNETQFDQTLKVFKFWMNKYKIPASRVVRHSDVSGDHVRGKGKGKTDPGSAFDWDKFQKQLVT
jgi:N-acetyl-anhydromuramyl-L-alanine amidase AmpD